MNRSFISSYRFALLVLAIGVAFTVVFGRLYSLHVLEHERLGKIVDSSRRRVQVLAGQRGNIVDAKQQILATTNAFRMVGVDPQAVELADDVKLEALAKLIDKPEAWIREQMSKRWRRVKVGDAYEVRDIQWVKLSEGVDENVYEEILKLGIKGVYGNRQYKRVYPGGDLAAHVIGFVNKIGQPIIGVERFFDFYLRGQDGWNESERDGRRRELVQFRSREVLPNRGLNLELGIDSMVQHFAEQELEQIMETYHAKSATILVSDPVTGVLLALAN